MISKTLDKLYCNKYLIVQVQSHEAYHILCYTSTAILVSLTQSWYIFVRKWWSYSSYVFRVYLRQGLTRCLLCLFASNQFRDNVIPAGGRANAVFRKPKSAFADVKSLETIALLLGVHQCPVDVNNRSLVRVKVNHVPNGILPSEYSGTVFTPVVQSCSPSGNVQVGSLRCNNMHMCFFCFIGTVPCWQEKEKDGIWNSMLRLPSRISG